MISIYKLINPINKEIFYVGATKLPLYARLCAHISKAKMYTRKQGLHGRHSISYKRHALIADILRQRLKPKIELIDIVADIDAAKLEAFHYHQLTSEGNVLLQTSEGMFYGEYNKSGKQG